MTRLLGVGAPAYETGACRGGYRECVAERGRRVPIGERVTQAHLDHFCPGGAGLPVTDSGPIGLGPVGDPPAGSEASAARTANQPCARCENPITPAQDARRRITGTWVHETCPPPTSG
jgi:hypothetical protein